MSYDGQRANVARGIPATLATWFLMSAGARLEAPLQVDREEPEDTDRRLLEWLEQTLTASTSAPPSAPHLKAKAKPPMTRGLREMLPQAD